MDRGVSLPPVATGERSYVNRLWEELHNCQLSFKPHRPTRPRSPDAPTRWGRWPSPRRPPGSSPTPLSASTPDGPTPARCGAWTPGGGPPRLTTPGSPPTSARSSRRAARAESAGSARQRRPDHSVLLRYQKASRERGGIRQRGRANSVAERVTLCKRTHQINEPIIRERCDDDLLNELR